MSPFGFKHEVVIQKPALGQQCGDSSQNILSHTFSPCGGWHQKWLDTFKRKYEKDHGWLLDEKWKTQEKALTPTNASITVSVVLNNQETATSEVNSATKEKAMQYIMLHLQHSRDVLLHCVYEEARTSVWSLVDDVFEKFMLEVIRTTVNHHILKADISNFDACNGKDKRRNDLFKNILHDVNRAFGQE